MHLRPDPRQREKSGSGFPVQPNAAMRVRHRMNKAFMESVGRLEFTPIGHRITAVRLAGAAAMFLLVINRKIARWSRVAGFADVALDRHQETIAFLLGLDHVKVLRR